MTAEDDAQRPGTAVRRLLPHAAGLADLWTTRRAPLPRHAWLGWLPHGHAVLFAVLVGLWNVNAHAVQGSSPSATLWLLGVLQSAAVCLALYRPASAWQLSTAALFLTALSADGRVGAGTPWPWSIAGIALHTLVLFLLALRIRPLGAIAAPALTLLAGAANAALSGHDHNLTVIGGAIPFTIAAVVGVSLRTSRVARERLAEQEELTAEEQTRRTLLEERGRIARELHDVVAHHMSVISIQAQVARHLVEDPPRELTENLAGIRHGAVEALTELRHILGVLRAQDPSAEGGRHAPQPTLDRLDELVATVRGAGLTVTAETTGSPRPLPPGVGLSAYRIVQEALSNAMRHAPGAAVRVAIAYHPSEITVQVVNSAPARRAPTATGLGHGLPGMRERAAMLGGELAAGPTANGGYDVTAILPDGTREPSAATAGGAL
ncbi:histidine kinase [Streptomyces sp. HNM0663]|uniref:histidine kinase n=1 Tax=Streptomyces chengmaiensis TaxID=3040919 RepID=A0ABT6HNI8_9ACTN|nr:histidine kinase [Streptomyces chengmaiensis]MDH2390296.1 histidine kinase [Streptomyces chengmaiensis]